MYRLSDAQVSFITADIRGRGITIDGLLHNLVDHVCCVLEEEMTEEMDFAQKYEEVVRRFFVNDLEEIQNEAIYLVTFKYYYAMRKTMIVSGVASVAAFFIGSIFKVMHWPGAGVLLVLGISLLSFLFLPLMCILKVKERTSGRNTLVMALGALEGMILCLAVMFTVMHWPGGQILWFLAVGFAFLVLIPVYFFTGIRYPETKVNTIVTTIVLFGAAGLLFTMLNLRGSARLLEAKMLSYVQAEQLLDQMDPEQAIGSDPLAVSLFHDCEKLKKLIVANATGREAIPPDFKSAGIIMEEGNLGDAFFAEGRGVHLVKQLKQNIVRFNTSASGAKKIPLEYSILLQDPHEVGRFSNYAMLHSLTQLQMFLAHSCRK